MHVGVCTVPPQHLQHTPTPHASLVTRKVAAAFTLHLRRPTWTLPALSRAALCKRVLLHACGTACHPALHALRRLLAGGASACSRRAAALPRAFSMASAVLTGTVDFSTTILEEVDTLAIMRAAPSQYVRSAALPAPTPRVLVGVFTLRVCLHMMLHPLSSCMQACCTGDGSRHWPCMLQEEPPAACANPL